MITGPADVVALFIILWPLLGALFLVIAKSDSGTSRVKRIQEWLLAKFEKLDPKKSYNKYFFRPFLWAINRIATQTDKISNQHSSAAAWVFCTGYAAYILLYIAIVIGMVAVAIAITIAIVMGIWEELGRDDDDDEYESGRERYTGMPPSGGRSVEREGFFGNYTEHQDADGNVIGESREQEGFLGTYTEHRDTDGTVVGESRDQEGFFGDFTEHRDADGAVVGESREQEGFLGNYTEHKDADGNVVGESRKREGFLGDYTEHEEK
jgi:hypothetical protein